jgi:plasmid stabilization system protein ParE
MSREADAAERIATALERIATTLETERQPPTESLKDSLRTTALVRIANALELERDPAIKDTLRKCIRVDPAADGSDLAPTMVRNVLTLLADMPECATVRFELLEGVEKLAGA